MDSAIQDAQLTIVPPIITTSSAYHSSAPHIAKCVLITRRPAPFVNTQELLIKTTNANRLAQSTHLQLQITSLNSPRTINVNSVLMMSVRMDGMQLHLFLLF